MQKTRKITKLNSIESLNTLKDFDLLEDCNSANKLKINSNELKNYLDLFSDNYKKIKFDSSHKEVLIYLGFNSSMLCIVKN